MLTIGEFSKACCVTKKTLRHYDAIGLLKPQYTAENGYRYYTVEQLRTMRLINRLKNYRFTLPEIAAALARWDEQTVAGLIMEKHRQLCRDLLRGERILAQMERDADKLRRSLDIMEQNLQIRLKEREPIAVYGIRQKMGTGDIGEYFEKLYRQVGERKLQIQGAPMTFYHDEDFNPESSDMELAVPVAKGQENRVVPGGLHCCTTYVGPYDDNFSAVYGMMTEWIEKNGYRICGPIADCYCKGVDDHIPPEEYVTEVCVPVRKK